MVTKPTYEELEQRNKQLEKESFVLNEKIKSLKEQSKSLVENALHIHPEYKTSTILDSLIELIIFIDLEMKVIWANKAACDSVNLKHENLIGLHCYELWGDGLDVCSDCVVAKAMKTGKVQEIEKTTSDDRAWFNRAYPVRDTDNNIIGGIEFVLDITTRKQAEKALRKSEEQNRELIQKIQAAVVLHDNKTQIIASNPKAQELLGLTEDQILGKTAIDPGWKFFQPDGFRLDHREYPVNLVLNTKNPVRNVIAGIYRPNRDDRVWVLVNADPMYDDQGEIQQVIVTFVDITEHKRSEEALLESQVTYRSIFNAVNDAIAIQRIETGEFLDANAQFCQLYGYTRDEVLKINIEDLSSGEHPFTQENATKYINKVIEGEPQIFEWLAKHSSGRLFWTEVSLKKGKINGQNRLVAVTRDITERKQAEKELHESEQRYHSLVEDTMDGYFIAEIDTGQLIFVNERICDLFGYTIKEALTLKLWDVTAPNEHALIRERIRARKVDKGSSYRPYIYDSIRKDGSKLRVEVSYSIITHKGKEAIQCILRDITEDEKMRLHLQQSQKMETVGRLAGGVAHDFNNMLGVIIGNVELAMEQVGASLPVQADLKEIYDAAHRSADLTKQLLAFARKQTILPRVLELNNTVRGMLKMLRRLIGEDIELNWKPSDDLWLIKIDPAQIDQILANLCVNARDAISGTGKVTIETKNVILDKTDCIKHRGMVPGEYVLLAVSDDGYGMNNDTLENLYEPFFTTKGIGEGTGLGLSTVYGIVKQNDGYIYASSKLGEGSTFNVYLHRTLEIVEVKRNDIFKKIQTGNEVVLFVEDEPSFLRLGKAVLERLGYTVLSVHKPSEALAISEQYEGPIDLLITDVVMPEMNGKELATQIVKLKPNISVLFMSGHTPDKIFKHDIIEKGIEFLPKPFSVNTLALKVRKILDQ